MLGQYNVFWCEAIFKKIHRLADTKAKRDSLTPNAGFLELPMDLLLYFEHSILPLNLGDITRASNKTSILLRVQFLAHSKEIYNLKISSLSLMQRG